MDARVRTSVGLFSRTAIPATVACSAIAYDSTSIPDGQKYLSEQGCRTLFFPPIRRNELTDI